MEYAKFIDKCCFPSNAFAFSRDVYVLLRRITRYDNGTMPLNIEEILLVLYRKLYPLHNPIIERNDTPQRTSFVIYNVDKPIDFSKEKNMFPQTVEAITLTFKESFYRCDIPKGTPSKELLIRGTTYAAEQEWITFDSILDYIMNHSYGKALKTTNDPDKLYIHLRDRSTFVATSRADCSLDIILTLQEVVAIIKTYLIETGKQQFASTVKHPEFFGKGVVDRLSSPHYGYTNKQVTFDYDTALVRFMVRSYLRSCRLKGPRISYEIS